jgi:hypothetical protein
MSIFKQLESNIGLPEDQLRMVTGFLLAIPMGFLFQQLSGKLACLKYYRSNLESIS